MDAKQTLNMLTPNAKISGNSGRAVADKPLSLNLKECLDKLKRTLK